MDCFRLVVDGCGAGGGRRLDVKVSFPVSAAVGESTSNGRIKRYAQDGGLQMVARVGQGSECNTDSLYSGSRSSSMNPETQCLTAPQAYAQTEHDDHEDEADSEKQSFLRNKRVDSVASRLCHVYVLAGPFLPLTVAHTILERFVILLGFLAITTGIVTFGGIFRGPNVFNGLAHFIKGGIFFWYGLLTFGRWIGCFADFGWAWNIKPRADVVGLSRAWIPSAEVAESFVIWLHGASNVFLELLAGSKEWSAMDLEHVAIAILFFGGGMLSSNTRKPFGPDY